MSGDNLTLEHYYVKTNGLTLHVVQAGPVEGPLVILLHGFPEFWYGWHKQIAPLVEAGYRVWLPDQRGYNLSDKPKGTQAYKIEQLAQDIIGLIEAAGREKAILIGHDWGGIVAWWVATYYPQFVERLILLNAPHPLVVTTFLRKDLAQLRKSWYVFYFRIPWLPERLLSLNHWRWLTWTLQHSARQLDVFNETDLAQYRQAWSQPGAMTGMLNWYRASFSLAGQTLKGVEIAVPTLLLWGIKDRYLGRELAEASIKLCQAGQLVFLPEATHWVQHEEAAEVNTRLLNFLKRTS